MDKAEVARRQLGAALYLFLRDQDPVSIHCLAAGGGEIAQWLAQQAGADAFIAHIRATFPNLAEVDIHKLRTRFWNAFKHASKQNRRDRNDEVLLASFDPSVNEHALYWGWVDYGASGLPLPIEAQVFEVWYMAKYLEKVSPDADLSTIVQVFPNLTDQSKARQLDKLNDVIRRYRKKGALMDDPKTDTRALLL